MNIPRFAAEASLYRTSRHYAMTGTIDQAGGIGNALTLAGTCTCTDPNCSWTCPSPDPCTHCGIFKGCARQRCLCECADGIPVDVRPSPTFPCGFECT